MKIFVSSLMAGMEQIRAAAKAAIEELGHTPVMAEDFVPSPRSPQVACLSGVREAGVTVLILGAEYGVRQPSGYSPTEEEFREARETRPVIAAWDYTFARLRGDHFVMVTLSDGSTVGGIYGSHSFASSDPTERDLFLQEIYDVDDGSWSKRPEHQAILIPSKEIKHVQIWSPKGT